MGLIRIIVAALECVIAVGRAYVAGGRLSDAIQEERARRSEERMKNAMWNEEMKKEEEK